jgi:hypothetical protein
MQCSICDEVYEETKLECGHEIHMKCIAMSGKDHCPICKNSVILPEEYQELFKENVKNNNDHIENQNRDAAVELSLREEPEPMNIYIHQKNISWIESPTLYYDISTIFEEFAIINYSNSTDIIHADKRSIRLAKIAYMTQEIAIENNIPLRDIFEAISTVLDL